LKLKKTGNEDLSCTQEFCYRKSICAFFSTALIQLISVRVRTGYVVTVDVPYQVRVRKQGTKTGVYFANARSTEISYMKYANGRRTRLVTFCVETVFYNGLLKERYKGG
jgi:hypothetical protein